MRYSIHKGLRTVGVLMAAVYFATQVAWAYTPEKNFWAERRRAGESSRQRTESGSVAALSAPASSLLNQLPAVSPASPAMSNDLAKTLPVSVTGPHAPLFNALQTTHGTIRKVWLPKTNAGERVVVHIQDVHQNMDAQRSIGGAIESLMKAGQAGVVGLEGSWREINVKAFHDFDNREVIRLTADYLLKENKITGPVHTAMTTPAPLAPVVGVDDPNHYPANVEAYRQSAPKMEEYKKVLANKRYQLAQEKGRVFSPALKQFDARVEAYHQRGEGLADYVSALIPKAGNAGLLAQAFEMEKALDFKKVEDDRQELITSLVGALSKAQMDQLIERSAGYRAGAVRYGDFYTYLKDLCRGAKIDLAGYPHMDAYIRYVLLSDRIDAEKLLAELNGLEKAGYAALAKTEEEKALVEKSRGLSLAGRLLAFELSSEDWAEYVAVNAGATLGVDVSSFESFYKEAHARDASLAGNLLKAMEGGEYKTGVLVTGGYHTQGVSEELVRQGVTVVTFTPRVEKVDTENGSSYLSIFTQEKTPLEKLFAGDKLFLGNDPAPAASQQTGAAIAAAGILLAVSGSAALPEEGETKLANATYNNLGENGEVISADVQDNGNSSTVTIVPDSSSTGDESDTSNRNDGSNNSGADEAVEVTVTKDAGQGGYAVTQLLVPLGIVGILGLALPFVGIPFSEVGTFFSGVANMVAPGFAYITQATISVIDTVTQGAATALSQLAGPGFSTAIPLAIPGLSSPLSVLGEVGLGLVVVGNMIGSDSNLPGLVQPGGNTVPQEMGVNKHLSANEIDENNRRRDVELGNLERSRLARENQTGNRFSGAELDEHNNERERINKQANERIQIATDRMVLDQNLTKPRDNSGVMSIIPISIVSLLGFIFLGYTPSAEAAVLLGNHFPSWISNAPMGGGILLTIFVSMFIVTYFYPNRVEEAEDNSSTTALLKVSIILSLLLLSVGAVAAPGEMVSVAAQAVGNFGGDDLLRRIIEATGLAGGLGSAGVLLGGVTSNKFSPRAAGRASGEVDQTSYSTEEALKKYADGDGQALLKNYWMAEFIDAVQKNTGAVKNGNLSVTLDIYKIIGEEGTVADFLSTIEETFNVPNGKVGFDPETKMLSIWPNKGTQNNDLGLFSQMQLAVSHVNVGWPYYSVATAEEALDFVKFIRKEIGKGVRKDNITLEGFRNDYPSHFTGERAGLISSLTPNFIDTATKIEGWNLLPESKKSDDIREVLARKLNYQFLNKGDNQRYNFNLGLLSWEEKMKLLTYGFQKGIGDYLRGRPEKITPLMIRKLDDDIITITYNQLNGKPDWGAGRFWGIFGAALVIGLIGVGIPMPVEAAEIGSGLVSPAVGIAAGAAAPMGGIGSAIVGALAIAGLGYVITQIKAARADSDIFRDFFNLSSENRLKALFPNPEKAAGTAIIPQRKAIERMGSKVDGFRGLVYRIAYRWFTNGQTMADIVKGLRQINGSLLGAALSNVGEGETGQQNIAREMVGITVDEAGVARLQELMEANNRFNEKSNLKRYFVVTTATKSVHEFVKGAVSGNPYFIAANVGDELSVDSFVTGFKTAANSLAEQGEFEMAQARIIMASVPVIDGAQESLGSMLEQLASSTDIDSLIKKQIAQAYLDRLLGGIQIMIKDMIDMMNAERFAKSFA